MARNPKAHAPVACMAMLLTLAACGGSDRSSAGDTVSAAGNLASTPSASSNTLVRGSIVAISGNDVTVRSDSGTVRVALQQPVDIYDREPSTLARVTPNTFVGVTSVKQPDGSEQATEIHIFPEALRGLGEGSHPMMVQGSGGSHGTMTNGSAMAHGGTMTNGSTMSNGSVQSAGGRTIVVQYNGGSKTIVVPPNTPVTEIVSASRPLAVGDQVVIVAARGANGSLSSNRVLLAGK